MVFCAASTAMNQVGKIKQIVELLVTHFYTSNQLYLLSALFPEKS